MMFIFIGGIFAMDNGAVTGAICATACQRWVQALKEKNYGQ